jgi:hypothetical protein
MTGHLPATETILRHFRYGYSDPRLTDISERFHAFACDLATRVADGPDLAIALDKLLDARKAAMHAAVIGEPPDG